MFNYKDSIDTINTRLAEEFSRITWIGEIPVTEDDFKLIASSISFSNQIKHIPPHILMVSMVFCARYAEFEENENINFWNKYFQKVVKKPKTQMLENEYRSSFKDARAKLQATYHFEFPTREDTSQEVVSGIYLHAILPAYLQDDFAAFFLKQYPNQAAWKTVDRLFADEIAAQNESAIFAPPTLKRLVRFLQSKDTSITAARLIKTLATAAMWYSEGQNVSDISSVLAPIEEAIWKQMVPMFPSLDTIPDTRPPSLRIRWAWLIEQNDILELHIKNLPITSETPPDRLVWLNSDDRMLVKIGETVPDYGRCYCEVNAYHTSMGYVIDSATLIDIEEEGVIVPVDQNDNALTVPIPTGSSPKQQVAFFRIQPEDHFAILSDPDRLTDGDYAVSLPDGITLKAAEGGIITRQYSLLVPKVLRDQSHTNAARYTIKLPILLGDKRIDKRRGRVAPVLEGRYPVEGLAFGALPIYEQGDVWLVVSPPSGVPLEKLSVRLTANDKVSVHRLSELDIAGQITHEVIERQHILRVRLNNYIPPACLLQVEVFSGVSRMHGDARLLGLLPADVHVTASSVETYYTLSQRPTVHITGVVSDQVALASDAQLEAQEGSVTVTWIDPRQDAALRLKFGEVILPLTFDVKWSFAWVTPLNGSYLLEDALNQVVLLVRGKPKSTFYISVADGEPREETLNARGVRDIRIQEHPLTEMLHSYHGERAAVKFWFADSDQPIELFTFLRPRFIEFEKQPTAIKEAIRAFKAVMRNGRRESGQPGPYSLVMLPNQYTGTVPPEMLPPLLKTLHELEPGAHPEACAVMPPRKQCLRLSEACSYSIQQQGDRATIMFNRPNSQEQTSLAISLEIRANSVYLRTTSTGLHQCLRCGDLFWADDKNTKFKHFHNQFGLDSRDLTTSSVAGKIEIIPWELDALRAFTPRFTPFIDRELQRSLRIRQRQKTHDLSSHSGKILTRNAYTQATAAWISRIGKHSEINNQFASLYKSHLFVDYVIEQFSHHQIPALIVANRWLIAERAERRYNDWSMLDPVIMTLAVIARAYAHSCIDLLDEEHFQLFLFHLQTAHHCCPELLNWALVWSEFIFLYLSDKADT